VWTSANYIEKEASFSQLEAPDSVISQRGLCGTISFDQLSLSLSLSSFKNTDSYYNIPKSPGPLLIATFTYFASDTIQNTLNTSLDTSTYSSVYLSLSCYSTSSFIIPSNPSEPLLTLQGRYISRTPLVIYAAKKKYKPVALKVRPNDEKYCLIHKIMSFDPNHMM